MSANIPSEEAEQVAVIDYLRYRNIPHWHTPNEGYRRPAYARKLKAQGVRAGVPDITIPLARCGYNHLYIEMKRRKGGRVSQAQQEMLDLLNSLGSLAVVCNGAGEAIEVIQKYVKGEIKAENDNS